MLILVVELRKQNHSRISSEPKKIENLKLKEFEFPAKIKQANSCFNQLTNQINWWENSKTNNRNVVKNKNSNFPPFFDSKQLLTSQIMAGKFEFSRARNRK